MELPLGKCLYLSYVSFPLRKNPIGIPVGRAGAKGGGRGIAPQSGSWQNIESQLAKYGFGYEEKIKYWSDTDIDS